MVIISGKGQAKNGINESEEVDIITKQTNQKW